jgi:hypothetical protein
MRVSNYARQCDTINPQPPGALVIALDFLSITLYLCILAFTVLNSYRYGWKRKLYAVYSMSLKYACIYLLLVCRIVQLCVLSTQQFYLFLPSFFGQLSQIFFVSIAILLIHNI